MNNLSVIGKSIPSIGSRDIVTGKAKYTGDFSFPGMLIGKLLYTAHPCARILSLDVSKARLIPDVVAILTSEDIPGENSYTVYDTDQPVLVEDYTRFQGDVVAAVAAETEDAAKAALDAIKVEYEPLQGIYDPIKAMESDSVQVWPNRNNIYDHLTIEYGNITAGFEKADIIIENTFQTPRIEHAFLEPEGAIALVENDGSIVVYAGCQAPFRDRNQIARSLGIQEHKVRVIAPYIGGAFGGKDEIHVQTIAALLAKKTNRPIRLIRSREESIRTHVKRHPTTIRFKSGVTKNGLITAIEVEAIGDTGPYVNMGKQVMHNLALHVFGPYNIPNARIDAYTVFTNNPTCGAMRGFGMVQAHFACERQMDELARATRLDPLEIRLRNSLENGSKLPSGVIVSNGKDIQKCLIKAAEIAKWKEHSSIQNERQPAPHLRRGWGIAGMINGYGLGRSIPDRAGIVVDMNQGGTVIIRTGAIDYGQGLHTILTQMVAESLGVEISSIKLVTPDTDKSVDAGSTSAARQSFISGNAVLRAIEPIKKSLLLTAAEETNYPIELLSLKDGFLYVKDEKINLPVCELATKALKKNRPLFGLGHYGMEYHDNMFSKDGYPNACEYYTFGAQVAQILVDVETGVVKVEELKTVIDVGKVLNLGGAVGQIEGGTAMGCGYALLEELISNNGRTINNSLESYLIPTVQDIPLMQIHFFETPEPNGPFGARALGESACIPTAPAIVNAVVDAIGGKSLNTIPITPERVLAAIENAKESH